MNWFRKPTEEEKLQAEQRKKEQTLKAEQKDKDRREYRRLETIFNGPTAKWEVEKGRTNYDKPTPDYAKFMGLKKLYNWPGGTRRKKKGKRKTRIK